LFEGVRDIIQGRAPAGARRSPEWYKQSREFLEGKACAACGGSERLQVHHILPFHLFPGREMDPTNWLVLCESLAHGVNCHLFLGHLGNFKSYNSTAKEDAGEWLEKIKKRP
jgi:hypothetical protein